MSWPSRCIAYSTLLTFPDITIKRCTAVNLANFIPLQEEGTPHECIADSLAFTRLRPDLESTPIPDAHVKYFVDGSCFRDHLDNHAGFAVVKCTPDDFVPVVVQHCEQPCSAQLAELKALTEACKLAKYLNVNIFKKSDGTPIQHGDQIIDLISVMMHPKKLAIIKCQAHKKGYDFVIRGNNAADQYVKQASGCTTAIMAPSVLIQPQPQVADVS